MGTVPPLLQLLFTLLLLCYRDLYEVDGAVHSKVQELTSENFDEALADPANGLWFLKFYAPWCGHCKTLAPVLDRVAPFLEGKMAFGKIDCTTEKKLCSKYNVKGFPTLMIHRDGETFPYPRERNADSIIEFGLKMSASPVIESPSYGKAIELGMTGNGVIFVAYDPNSTGDTVQEKLQSSVLLQVFGQIARKQQAYASFSLLVGNPSSDELAKFGAGNEAFIAKIEQDVPPQIFNGSYNSVEFLSFVKTNNVALVTEIGSNNFKSLGNMGKLLAIGVINPKVPKKNVPFITDLRSVALNVSPEIKSKYVFGTMDGIKWKRFLSQFNVDSEKLPSFFILDVKGKTFWEADDEKVMTIEEIVTSHYKGELIPKVQGSGKARQPWYMNPWIIVSIIGLFFAGFFFMSSSESEIEEINEGEVSSNSIKDETKKEK